MKKVLAFLLTAMLAVTALTATAAPSPEKSSGVIVSVSAKDTAGKSYNVEVKPSTVDQSVYNDAFAAFKQENGSDFKIVDQKKLEGNVSAGSPLTVELSVPGVKATSKVYILLKKSNGEIVKLDATAGTGKVTATFTELGEFVLITDAQTDAFTDNDDANTGENEVAANSGLDYVEGYDADQIQDIITQLEENQTQNTDSSNTNGADSENTSSTDSGTADSGNNTTENTKIANR